MLSLCDFYLISITDFEIPAILKSLFLYLPAFYIADSFICRNLFSVQEIDYYSNSLLFKFNLLFSRK